MASRPCEDTGISWRVVLLVGVAAVLAFASHLHLGEEPLPETHLSSSMPGPVAGSPLPALRMLPSGVDAVEAGAPKQRPDEAKPGALDYDPRSGRADRTPPPRGAPVAPGPGSLRGFLYNT